MDDVHAVPLDEAALDEEVSNCLDILGLHDRIALVLRRDDGPCEVFDPELLGDLGHFRSPIQEKLPNPLVDGRTLVWRRRCNQSESIAVAITSDPPASG